MSNENTKQDEAAEPKRFDEKSFSATGHQTKDGIDLTLKVVIRNERRTTVGLIVLYMALSEDGEKTLTSVKHNVVRTEKRTGSRREDTYRWVGDHPWAFSHESETTTPNGRSSTETLAVPLTESFDPRAVVTAYEKLDEASFRKFLAAYLPADLGTKSL